MLLERLLGEEDALEDLGPRTSWGWTCGRRTWTRRRRWRIFAMVTAAVSNLKLKVTSDGKVVEKSFMKMVVFLAYAPIRGCS